MFGPTVSPQLVQSGKGRIASNPALLNLPRPLVVGAFSVHGSDEQIFGRIQQVRQPRPQLSKGSATLIDLCSVNRSKRSRHSYRHRVRRSGRCQPNLARPQLSGGGLERGRSVIYRVFMNDEDFVVVYADSPEEAMLKLRDAGLEPVKAEPFDAHRRRSKGAAPAR